MTIRVWYPLYDKQLACIGMCLEADVVSGPFDVGNHIDEYRLIQRFITPRKLLLSASSWMHLSQAHADLLPATNTLVYIDSFFQKQTEANNLLAQWIQNGVGIVARDLSNTQNYIQLDAAQTKVGIDERVLLDNARQGINLIARAIGSLPLFLWCRNAGFSYFSFSALNVVQYSEAPPPFSALPIMQLLSLLEQDADMAELEQVFKRDPKLAFELLKMVNSAEFGARKEITSFTQAMMILGQSQLRRWLQLLVYAQAASDNQMPNILMQRAAERGRLMELLAERSNCQVSAEQAFMVGVFSLLDVLMSTPLKTLLAEVSLPVYVAKALLEGEGELGSLLNLISAIENSRFTSIQRLQAKLALTDEVLSITQLEAITWALSVTRS